MPRQVRWDAYYSAPPLSTTTLRPPRISRDVEVRRPRGPLVLVKREIDLSEVELLEFVVDDKFKIDVKPQVVLDPRQLQLAALSIPPTPSSASTSSGEGAAAPGPSQWAHRTEALCRVPSQSLGPADQPRGKGRPKGSNSRPRIPIVFGLSTPPERAASVKARESLAKMTPPKKV